MKFEEALKLLRKGKRITHPYFEPDVYFVGCYVGIMFSKESIEDRKARGMSIVKMKGKFQHPDMGLGDLDKFNIYDAIYPCKHGNAPQLNLFLVMSDEWEIYNEHEQLG